ncbi:MAG: hypothetical protein FGM24_02565 [Candidatus Kapabacteria bacterium]|nr:hypothetical protein [Candidatus Kapabacteria bacterium]
MRLLATILALLFCAKITVAQGFDWQYSARYPTSSPTRFLGAAVGGGYAIHQGRLPYLEQDVPVACCTYENGTGLPLSIVVGYEQWTSANIAVHGMAGYRLMTAGMSAPPTFDEPLSDGRLLVTQYTYNANLHYADITGGVRYRLGRSHLSVGAALRLSLLLGTTATHRLDVISPSDYTFNTNPPSRSIDIPVVGVPDATPLLVSPLITLGYDISIANGLYLSPLLTIGLPLMNTANGVTWKTGEAAMLLRVMRAL